MATNIDQLAQDNMQRNNIAAAALEKTFADMQGAYGRAGQAMQGYGEDKSLVVKTEALATAEAQAQTRQAAAVIGTDPNSASYQMSKLVAESQALYEKKQQIGQQLLDEANPDGKNIFQIAWGRAFLQNRVREYNTVSTMEQAATTRLRELNAITQDTARTNNMIAQTVTVESANALARATASEAAQKMAGLEIESLKTGAQGIVQVAQLRNSNLDIALKQRDQQLQEQQIGIARQNAALSAASLKLSMLERQDRMDDKEQDRLGKQQQLAAINAGRALSNLPPIGSYIELQNTARMNPEMEKQFSQQYMQGITAATTGRATVADTPWDAAKFKAGTGAKYNDGRSKVFEYLDRVIGQVQNDPKIPAADRTKEKVMSAAVNNTAIAGARSQLSDVLSGGSDNIYRPAPTATFLADPEFSKTYISQKILGTMNSAGMDSLPVPQIAATLMADVRAGKVSAEQANSELGFLATKAMGYNNALYRYQDTAGLPNMSSMNVRLEDTSSLQNFTNRIAGPGAPLASNPVMTSLNTVFGGTGKTTVNLADPVSRSDYINRQMSLVIPPVLRQQAATQQSTRTGAGRVSSGRVTQSPE